MESIKRRLRRDGVAPIVERKELKTSEHRRESAIERDILRWLNERGGFYAFKIHTTGQFDRGTGSYRKHSVYAVNGVSDVVALKDGVVLFLEVKAPHGKQSADQVKFMKAVRSMGGNYEVVTSVEDVEEIAVRLFGV